VSGAFAPQHWQANPSLARIAYLSFEEIGFLLILKLRCQIDFAAPYFLPFAVPRPTPHPI